MKVEAAEPIELRLIEDADRGTPCWIDARQVVAERRLGDRVSSSSRSRHWGSESIRRTT